MNSKITKKIEHLIKLRSPNTGEIIELHNLYTAYHRKIDRKLKHKTSRLLKNEAWRLPPKSNLCATVGENIKRVRIGAKLTQREVAIKSELTPPKISKIECGRETINIEDLKKIADVLDVPPSSFFEEKQAATVELDTALEGLESMLELKGLKYCILISDEASETVTVKASFTTSRNTINNLSALLTKTRAH